MASLQVNNFLLGRVAITRMVNFMDQYYMEKKEQQSNYYSNNVNFLLVIY
jgi:hypothetical protein